MMNTGICLFTRMLIQQWWIQINIESIAGLLTEIFPQHKPQQNTYQENNFLVIDKYIK